MIIKEKLVFNIVAIKNIKKRLYTSTNGVGTTSSGGNNEIGCTRTFHEQKPMIVGSVFDHSMTTSLRKYLYIKMHPLITSRQWKKIVVIGAHERKNSIVSTKEKTDKLFNWQRPTAVADGEIIVIKCYPGVDYVRHYASMISTYLSMNNMESSEVRYIVPDENECLKPIAQSNIKDLGQTHTAILGYVHGILPSAQKWKGRETEDFSWVNKSINGKNVAFIGCRHSYWGDISARIVQALHHQANVQRVIYVGKLGGLKPHHVPNKLLATGCKSFIEGEFITWKNIFDHVQAPYVIQGVHCTLPSVMFETKEWFNYHSKFDFVDPEIGHMARACSNCGIEFSYIHILSDNVSIKFIEDLSNERDERVIGNRNEIVKKLNKELFTVLQEQ